MTTVADAIILTEAGPVVALAQIRAWRPCAADYRTVKNRYPGGVPVDLPAWLALIDAGVDVAWGALHLLTDDERVAIILWTLRRRQPHLVALLRRAELPEHADRVEALRFDTIEDAAAAIPTLDASRDASWAAPWAAPWAASWAASRDASWAASRDASWAASWAASRAASWDEMQRAVCAEIVALLAARPGWVAWRGRTS